jgi:hypothetical protein
MFVSQLNPMPQSLFDVHRAIFAGTKPFAWFVAEHFDGWERIKYDALPGRRPPPFHPQPEALKELVRGKFAGIERLGLDFDAPPLLPSKTVKVRAVHGLDRPGRRRS